MSNMSASCLCVSITQTSWSFLFRLEKSKEIQKEGVVLEEQMTSCEESRKESQQQESEKCLEKIVTKWNFHSGDFGTVSNRTGAAPLAFPIYLETDTFEGHFEILYSIQCYE